MFDTRAVGPTHAAASSLTLKCTMFRLVTFSLVACSLAMANPISSSAQTATATRTTAIPTTGAAAAAAAEVHDLSEETNEVDAARDQDAILSFNAYSRIRFRGEFHSLLEMIMTNYNDFRKQATRGP